MIATLRKALPAAAIPLVVRTRTRRALADEPTRKAARAHIEYLLGNTDRAGEIDDITERFVEQNMWRAELRWHPRLLTGLRIVGWEAARDRAPGRGAVATFLHHGPYDGIYASMGHVGLACSLVAGSELYFGDVLTPVCRQQTKLWTMNGGRLISADGGSKTMLDLVKQGGILAAALDVPGSDKFSFLGQTVFGSAGGPRVAKLSDVPIFPLSFLLDDDGAYLHVGDAIEPADFANTKALVAEVIRRHEPAVLQWPEALEAPLERWRPEGAPTSAHARSREIADA